MNKMKHTIYLTQSGLVINRICFVFKRETFVKFEKKIGIIDMNRNVRNTEEKVVENETFGLIRRER